jgi:hypothetical protein
VLDRVFSWGIALAGFVIMAGMAIAAIKIVLGSNWITAEQREELEGKYGHWAVETALSVVPRRDVEKLEREAKRLYESRLVRGF